MLLQTNSYIVPKDKRTEHNRLVKRFRQVFARLGCEDFEIYEQTGPNWSTEIGGRFVQIMKFRDQAHAAEVRQREQQDPVAQELVREFCELINFNYQYQQNLSTSAYYTGVVTGPPTRAIGDAKALPEANAPEMPADQTTSST